MRPPEIAAEASGKATCNAMSSAIARPILRRQSAL
jgi:hypothetical protein